MLGQSDIVVRTLNMALNPELCGCCCRWLPLTAMFTLTYKYICVMDNKMEYAKRQLIKVLSY